MNPTLTPPATRRPARRLWLWGLLATPLLMILLLGIGVASFFHLGSDLRALRNDLIRSGGVEWRQVIALNANTFALGSVRAGLSWVPLHPGARAAFQSIRNAGVGVYQLPDGTPPPDLAAMLTTADSAMTARGWERVVGVADGHDLVAVYLSNDNAVRRLKCAVMVFDGKEMVLISVQGNPEPLVQYAFSRRDLCARVRQLTQR